jgi:5-methylcytosine-specific restriction endonuclease McrA
MGIPPPDLGGNEAGDDHLLGDERTLDEWWRRVNAHTTHLPFLYRLAVESVRAARQRTVSFDPVAARAAFDRDVALKQCILARDRYTCQGCGRADTRIEVDHVVPLRYGGSNREVNLQALCRTCNAKKAATCALVDIVVRGIQRYVTRRRAGEVTLSNVIEEVRKNVRRDRKLSAGPLLVGLGPIVTTEVVLPTYRTLSAKVLDRRIRAAEEQDATIDRETLEQLRTEWESIEGQAREEVLRRDEYRCLQCGKRGEGLELFAWHRAPLYQGGTNDSDNLRTLCGPCRSTVRQSVLRPWTEGLRSVRMPKVALPSRVRAEVPTGAQLPLDPGSPAASVAGVVTSPSQLLDSDAR